MNDNKINQKTVIEPDEIDNEKEQEEKASTVLNNNHLNIDDIKESWQSFIDKVHIKKPSIASILDKSVAYDIVDGYIMIKISSALDFHLNMIEKNTDIINGILSSIFGEGIRFNVEKNSDTNVMASDEKKGKQTDSSERDEQIRDKIVDLFDGEILT